MAPAAGVGAHVGRAAETGNAAGGGGGGIALQVDLQRRADEHVAGIVAGGLGKGAVAAHRAVGSDEEDVGPGADIVFHAQFGAEGMHRFDEAGLDRRDQRRVRIQRPVAGDLAAQAERFGIGRQEQFDGGGVEADAVVQALTSYSA
jgi:hypothetical protein